MSAVLNRISTSHPHTWVHYLTFSHEHNTWLAGRPGHWTRITAGTARRLVDAGYRVLDI